MGGGSGCLYILQALALLLSLLVFLQPGPARGDADFNSVRVRLDYQDSSGRGGDPPGKYWRILVSYPMF